MILLSGIAGIMDVDSRWCCEGSVLKDVRACVAISQSIPASSFNYIYIEFVNPKNLAPDRGDPIFVYSHFWLAI